MVRGMGCLFSTILPLSQSLIFTQRQLPFHNCFHELEIYLCRGANWFLKSVKLSTSYILPQCSTESRNNYQKKSREKVKHSFALILQLSKTTWVKISILHSTEENSFWKYWGSQKVGLGHCYRDPENIQFLTKIRARVYTNKGKSQSKTTSQK